MARITPGGLSGLLRTMRCILRCPPRLAARQRGILAFMPLTVVGPGRLLVTGEAARVRPGDDGCVSLRSQVPLPFPAFKTPPEGAPRRVDRDRLHVGEFHYKVNRVDTAISVLRYLQRKNPSAPPCGTGSAEIRPQAS